MKLIPGDVNNDFHRDVFWQRSFIESDAGELLSKIIVCTTKEFCDLKGMSNGYNVNDKIVHWFEDRTNKAFEHYKESENPEDSYIDIHPKIPNLLEFARSL
ncbi:MAG: hypothetical protein JWP09_793 [Candidatus Taylorbacteria bacterium]|nr:hypothetical protein [Candidatus Taylorbacteria bacterium]